MLSPAGPEYRRAANPSTGGSDGTAPVLTPPPRHETILRRASKRRRRIDRLELIEAAGAVPGQRRVDEEIPRDLARQLRREGGKERAGAAVADEDHRRLRREVLQRL